MRVNLAFVKRSIVYSFLLCTYFFSQGATAAKAESASLRKFATPILSASKVVEISEHYLLKTENIDLTNYFLSSVSFEFYSPEENLNIQNEAKWYISYQCKPIKDSAPALGCDFSVSVTNTKTPVVTYFPGR